MTKNRTDSDASRQGAGALCERFAGTAVDYLQQAVKDNPNLKLDAQELAFQSRQFKKDEKERCLNRTQKTAEA